MYAHTVHTVYSLSTPNRTSIHSHIHILIHPDTLPYPPMHSHPHPLPPQPTSEEVALDEEAGPDFNRVSSCRDLVTDFIVTEKALKDDPQFYHHQEFISNKCRSVGLCVATPTGWRTVI